MSEDNNNIHRNILWKEVAKIKQILESQPRECLIQTHKKIKQILQLTDEEYFRKQAFEYDSYCINKFGIDQAIRREKNRYFMNISVSAYETYIKNIDKPDQQVFNAVKEFSDLEKSFITDESCGFGIILIEKIAEKNPELLGQAIQFYKKHNASLNLLRAAQKNPEFKKDIVDFLRDHINYDAKNYLELRAFVLISGDEQIKEKVIQTLRRSEKAKQNYVLASVLASLSNNQNDISRAVSLIRQYEVPEKSKHDPILHYGSILENKLSLLFKGDAKNQIFKEVFHKAEDSLLSINNGKGDHWTHMNGVVRMCVDNDSNIIPEALNLLKKEIKLFQTDYKKLGFMCCDVNLQSDTLFYALDHIVQKDPSRAKEAFEIGKDYNRALDLDEKFTCYVDKGWYYRALGTFAKADESLKPEIISIIKENLAQDNKEDLLYGCNVKSGQKVLQELTAPKINRAIGHDDR